MRIPIAPEGWPFIAVFALISIGAAFLVRPWVAVFPLLLMLFMLFFFRDPQRTVPDVAGIFVSPADGKVIIAKEVYEDEYLKSDAVMVSIFMSPLDVHVNRSPMSGVVEKVVHSPGRFIAAFKEEASMVNERLDMVLKGSLGRILVRQVAGFLARRAVCRVRPGDALDRGERYGVIKFGSRLDVYMPSGTEVPVKVGQAVRAGETVLGKLPG